MDATARELERRGEEGRAWLAQVRSGALPAASRPWIDAVLTDRLPRAALTLGAFLGAPELLALVEGEVVERTAFLGDLGALGGIDDDASLSWEDLAAWLAVLGCWSGAHTRAHVAAYLPVLRRVEAIALAPVMDDCTPSSRDGVLPLLHALEAALGPWLARGEGWDAVQRAVAAKPSGCQCFWQGHSLFAELRYAAKRTEELVRPDAIVFHAPAVLPGFTLENERLLRGTAAHEVRDSIRKHLLGWLRSGLT